jgi:hypothetical protein|tara:strand:- start:68 stop:262 length:195 start_codon:yes stop_codon:yes gene_type:complete
MNYVQIKSFLTQVNKMAVRGDPQLRMTLADAVKLQTELTFLLVELSDTNKTPNTITFDGGKFNA